MKVYCVISSNEDGQNLQNVFSTNEKAEEYITEEMVEFFHEAPELTDSGDYLFPDAETTMMIIEKDVL